MINVDRSFIAENRMEMILGLSLIPLFIKSLSYALIGSFTPTIVFLFFGVLLLSMFTKSSRFKKSSVKIWSIAIILWGIARIILMTLFLTTSVQEAHVESQFGVWYILLSVLYITIGVYLFRSVKKQSV
ncbi:MAG: hypothetical protein ROO71_09705 [Balneola sp.]